MDTKESKPTLEVPKKFIRIGEDTIIADPFFPPKNDPEFFQAPTDPDVTKMRKVDRTDL